ncbi:hypothetical protein BT93_L2725 [Corymbia citriodora subsp. variegata]|uniref:DUF4220 domain-containing protein n=1 Tax=Corymbia citriodora subsp. variegata TaxID=360336 RepID=A0A8T0CPB9_CORYI|nr:hypothetical protein BT93_L2725 [Corymbia citriodora subsp. variegata]
MNTLAGANNLSMKQLNLRMAILASLSLQVFLIFFGPVRKRCSKRWIRNLIWLAYLAADWVVDYAFGLMVQAQSSSGMSDCEANAYGNLLAFWAPFLLLHLGGPDTVTAVALEDNELWGRHLLNLLCQVGAAGYVFYQSFPNGTLIVPTILLFIGGTIKYIERTCALYFASFSKFRGSLLPPADAGPNYAEKTEQIAAAGSFHSTVEPQYSLLHDGAEEGQILDDETVIKEAFFYFTSFKGILVDLIFSHQDRRNSYEFFSVRTAKDAFRVIEAELNFFYDVLYTKAAIVHRPTGYLFRAISFGSIVAAFACFYVLNKHGFHEYDIQITYALLLGALSLEFVALGLLICSDWTIAKIVTSEEYRRSQFVGRIFVKFFLMVKSESSPFALHMICARWSRSLFQYNLIEFRLRKWPKWIEKILALIPLGKLLEDLKSEQVKPYSEELGELIFDELKRKAKTSLRKERKQICSARGEWALEHTKTEQDCQNLLRFVRDVDYGESLLLWHIATELCYNKDESENNHRKYSKVLSDYMLHLMIKEPDLMSVVIGIGQIRFRDTCADLDRFLSDESKTNITEENVCESLLSVPTPLSSIEVKGDRSKSVLFDACILAKGLETLQENKWEIVSEVWVELLAHAAINCRPYMHAQQLSKGGELVALVWLLMVHLGLSEQFQIARGHANTQAN